MPLIRLIWIIHWLPHIIVLNQPLSQYGGFWIGFFVGRGFNQGLTLKCVFHASAQLWNVTNNNKDNIGFEYLCRVCPSSSNERSLSLTIHTHLSVFGINRKLFGTGECKLQTVISPSRCLFRSDCFWSTNFFLWFWLLEYCIQSDCDSFWLF